MQRERHVRRLLPVLTRSSNYGRNRRLGRVSPRRRGRSAFAAGERGAGAGQRGATERPARPAHVLRRRCRQQRRRALQPLAEDVRRRRRAAG